MVQYRQLQAPAQLDTSIPDSGAASAYQSLAQTFKEFSNKSFDVAAQVNAEAGARRGATEGAAGTPAPLSGWRGMTSYGKAYNNAAIRSYTIKAEADAEDTAARLQVEAGTDVGKFQTTFTAARDATIKQAPPEVSSTLMDIYNQHAGQAVARIATARGLELRDQSRVDTSEGISRLTEQAGNMYAQDDPASHRIADEANAKVGMLIDGARNDGTISDVEAAALHTDAQHKITFQTVVGRFQKELDNPMGDPVAFIQRLHDFNQKDNALLPAEKEKLENQLYANLARKTELESKSVAMTRMATEARYQAGDRDATAALLSGTLTQPKLLEMVTSQNLKPEIGRTLLNALKEGDPGVDDAREVMNVETDLLNHTREDIMGNSRLKFSTRTRLINELDKRSNDWASTQNAREGEARIDRALGIVPGTITAALSPDKAKQRFNARTEWYNRIAFTDPAARDATVIPAAEAVIKQYIKDNSSDEAKKQHRLRDALVAATPLDSLNKAGRAAYDAQLAQYDRRIRDAEAQAARQ